MTDTKELRLLTQAVVKGWGNCDQAWLDQSEDTPAAVVGHIDEVGETYPVATIDCDQYYAGHQSLPLAKFYAAANPAAISELLDRLEAAEKERDELRESEKWYRRRCDLLQEQQSKMRDPERTIVCDILANGVLLHADFAGDRYTIPGEMTDDRYTILGEMTDDKRRIDACLKACEGISTQNLEDNIPFLELVQRYNAMQRERDALRAKIEAAEKSDAESLAMYRKARDERDALRAALQHEADCVGAAKAEIKALRAKIEQMEQQEPVGVLHVGSYYGEELQDWEFEADQRVCDDLNERHATNPTSLNLYALPGAQNVPKAVAYLDLGTGGYMDIGTDLTDEALAALPKGRHMLGIVGTYGVDGYVPAQPAPSVPDGWKLVPVEPTPEMLRALIDGANQYDSWNEGYRDMLAAAPEAKP